MADRGGWTRQRRGRAAVAVALLGGAAASVTFVACGGPEFLGGNGSGADAAADAGPIPELDGGHPFDASLPDSSAADSGRDAGPATGTIVYANAKTGSDSNSGLSTAAPKKSLASAVAAALALDAGAEVHACAGTYAESALDVSGAISLRGAYDCTTWARTATFGYPTFDATNATLVTNANPAANGATLTVSGNVPATSVIDGLAIEGAATLDGQTIGLFFTGNASPLVSDDAITGGGGHTTGIGSIGVSIAHAASPEVMHDVINGGAGTGESIGVVINSTGTPHVHDDIVSGGLGAPTSQGIFVQSSTAAPNALENNVVTACDAQGTATTTSGIQINAPDASVEVRASQIDGCVGASDAGGSSVGVRVSSPGASVQILTSRVFGGARSGPASFVAGVSVAASLALTVHDSMIHAGEETGSASSANGLSISGATSASIADDTIYAGAFSGTAIVLEPGAQKVSITNVLILSGGTGQTRPGVFAGSCSGILATLDHDVFANSAGALYACNGTDGGANVSATTLGALTALLPSAATDLVYMSVCADDDAGDETPGCVTSAGACPSSPTTCLGGLFGAAWTGDDGITGLFPFADGGAGGWSLPVGTSCAIAEGGVPVAGIATDIYGAARSPTTPTIGAAELVGACAP